MAEVVPFKIVEKPPLVARAPNERDIRIAEMLEKLAVRARAGEIEHIACVTLEESDPSHIVTNHGGQDMYPHDALAVVGALDLLKSSLMDAIKELDDVD